MDRFPVNWELRKELKISVLQGKIWRDLKVEESVRQYTFNDLILTFDFLFSINSISINSEGKVCLN